MLTVYSVLCGVLIIIGIALFVEGFPYITNNVHKKVTSIHSYMFDKLSIWVTIKMETLDVFSAGNPIDVEVTATPMNLDEIRQIQLSFEGAAKYFPSKLPSPPTMPPFNSSRETWDQFEKEQQEYWSNFEKYMKEIFEKASANILFLRSDRNITDFTFPNLPENISIPKFSTFSGALRNLTYSSGGKFDVGFTVTQSSGNVVGYGLGDTTYALREAIEVSPPETLLQINNSNVMSGLGWIGLGLPFLIAGLTGFLEIVKHFAFGS